MNGTAQAIPASAESAFPAVKPHSRRVAKPLFVLPKDKASVIVCQDNLLFMHSLPDESMKLIVTSPPYNLGKEYETKSSLDAYLDAQRETIKEAVRLLHPKGSICWQIGNYVEDGEVYPLDILLYPVFKQARLQLRNRIIWTFGHGLHCQKRLSGRYETILWFTKGNDYTFNLKGTSKN